MSGEVIEFQFKTVYDFVDNFVRPMYATSSTRTPNWSRRWWAHEEAIVRFHALWQAYEAGRAQAPATHLESFLRVCSDYHMRFIMADGGVFADSKRDDVPSVPLPADPASRA